MSLIIQPPRAFSFVAVVQFEADTRDDETIKKDIMRAFSVSLELAPNVRQYAIVPAAVQPPPGSAT